jgi:hypothetical protein
MVTNPMINDRTFMVNSFPVEHRKGAMHEAAHLHIACHGSLGGSLGGGAGKGFQKLAVADAIEVQRANGL